MAVDTSPPLHITVHPLPDHAGASTPGQFWSGDTPSFKDVLDTINPLQHIPIISTIYQNLTGDVPSSGANVIGGTLLGGPIGLASALFNEIVKTQTGKDVGGNVLAMINGESSTQSADSSTSSIQYAPSPTNQAAYNAYMHAKSLPA